jgi:hypothetical protein
LEIESLMREVCKVTKEQGTQTHHQSQAKPDKSREELASLVSLACRDLEQMQ